MEKLPLAKMDPHSGERTIFHSRTTTTDLNKNITTTTTSEGLSIQNNNSAQSMMAPYQEACKVDAGLQSMDKDLKTGVRALCSSLADNGVSTSSLKKVGDNVRNLNQKSSDAVLEQRNALGSKNLNSGDEESFNLLVDVYMDNSLQMLTFCSELDRFLKAAHNTHSYIESVTRKCSEKQTGMETSDYTTITKKLKDLKASEDVYSSAERLSEAVGCLLRQQEQMLLKLTAQKEKLGEKGSRAPFWHKLLMTLFGVIGVGLGISMIVKAALAIPADAKSLGACFVAMPSGEDWITKWFEIYDERYETALKDHPQRETNVAMQAGARVSIKELGDIQFLIDKVVNEIDSLLFSPNSTIKEQIDFTMKDIKPKLETFRQEIEALQKELNICISEIRQARDKVAKKFSGGGWCTIL